MDTILNSILDHQLKMLEDNLTCAANYLEAMRRTCKDLHLLIMSPPSPQQSAKLNTKLANEVLGLSEVNARIDCQFALVDQVVRAGISDEVADGIGLNQFIGDPLAIKRPQYAGFFLAVIRLSQLASDGLINEQVRQQAPEVFESINLEFTRMIVAIARMSNFTGDFIRQMNTEK